MMISRVALSHEHLALANVADAIMTAIAQPDFDVVEVIRLRWRLSHLLAVHLAKEDHHIYPRLKQHRDLELATMATAFETEMGGLREGYRTYMNDWAGERIAAERALFVSETRTLLTLLGRRIDREEAELYPMYERATRPGCAKGLSASAGNPSVRRVAADQRRS